ncbi:hypothetical protein [uncultured Acinetobacter sp.]|uniref:hypothetical protein n=1 Tax=uncultured Acinetobacter sp. TaxID=165433 RepID=UPI002634AD00|nr:hypothetical protein [uncultured Acinetobacter sp.]
MIGQQRQILTELGIDLWIPRDAACQNLDLDAIWRDQRSDTIEVLMPHQPAVVQVQAQPIVSEPPPVQTKVLQEQIVATPVFTQAEVVEHHTHLDPFELQLLSLPHCILIIDASALSRQAQQLWANIHAALQADYQQLNWPFPLLNLQEPQGAYSYMQGFFAVHGLDKQLLVLGELPYMPQQSLNLPSLEDMLAQPILKKQLWNALNNK